MKLLSRSLCLLFLLTAAPLIRADELKAIAPAPSPAPTPGLLGKWSVRVEVFMVALPQEKALALLPALRDDAKIDAACAELTEMIKHKEATLTGYPLLVLGEGTELAWSQTNLEKIYPTQFQPPQTPTSFEKRNVGPELRARCQVSGDGSSIGLQVEVKRVELLGFDAYKTEPPRDGAAPAIEQPLFFSTIASTTVTVRSGQRTLLGVHQLVRPDGYTEFFVLQATAALAR